MKVNKKSDVGLRWLQAGFGSAKIKSEINRQSWLFLNLWFGSNYLI